MQVESINRNIKVSDLRADDLFIPQNFESVKYLAYDFIDSLDFDNALKLAGDLSVKLDQADINDPKKRKLFNILKYWVWRLKLLDLFSLSPQERVDLFKSSAFAMLYNGLNLELYVYKFIDFYSTPSIVLDETKNLAMALANSNELAGSNVNGFREKNFRPTVANWIKEYQPVLHASSSVIGESESGTFYIIKFLDTNPFVGLLTKQERDTLKDLLGLYNWLLSPIRYVDEDFKGTPPAELPESEEIPTESEEVEPEASVEPAPTPITPPIKIEPVAPVLAPPEPMAPAPVAVPPPAPPAPSIVEKKVEPIVKPLAPVQQPTPAKPSYVFGPSPSTVPTNLQEILKKNVAKAEEVERGVRIPERPTQVFKPSPQAVVQNRPVSNYTTPPAVKPELIAQPVKQTVPTKTAVDPATVPADMPKPTIPTSPVATIPVAPKLPLVNAPQPKQVNAEALEQNLEKQRREAEEKINQKLEALKKKTGI